jgi:rhodanese-related sulfurtransferase
MKPLTIARSILFKLLLALTLVLAACGAPTTTTAPSAAEPAKPAVQAPAPAQTDNMYVLVDKYLSTLPENYNAITKVDALKDLMSSGNALIVDVREPTEYAEGHIPGAINIPLRTLTKNLDKIPTDKPVVLSCASGLRASLATTSLQLLGYTNVRDFYLSYKGWTAANEPVSRDAVEAKVVGTPKVDPQVLTVVDKFLTGLPENYYAIGKTEALRDLMTNGNALVVDVREPKEYADGHIPGAINVPVRTLAKNLDKLPKDRPVVLSCASGLRCALAMPTLQMLGYSNARTFPPSFKGWTAAFLPVEK